ncbi:MAG: hypothetical protein ABR588_09885 [Sphingomicrobium sp.]|nr:hypothetical protein [Sphingomonadales bacterium]
MIALLLAAAAGSSAIDAEKAFARDAQHIGQWAAFRKWADRDAVMFVPQAAWARDFLKGRKEPPRAVRWQPAESIASCDGQVAVNSGPWSVPGRKVQGRFTTIWINKAAGWRWIYDGGEPLAKRLPLPQRVKLVRASCSGRPTGAPIAPPPKIAPTGKSPADLGRGESGDRTLGWDWKVGPKGARTLRVFQWTGRAYRRVLDQHIAAE